MRVRARAAACVIAIGCAVAGCEALLDSGSLSNGSGAGADAGGTGDDALGGGDAIGDDAGVGGDANGGDGAFDAGDGQTAPSAYALAVLADAPLVYWRMGIRQGTVVPDATGHGNDLVLHVGTETLGLPGAIANDGDTAIGFDGTTSWAAATDAGPFQFAGRAPFTLECWAKFVPSSFAGYYEHLMGESVGDQTQRSGYIFYTAPAASGATPPTAAFEVDIPGTQQGAYGAITSPTSYAHYVAVFDGTNATVYENGQQVAQAAITGDQAARTADLMVGADHGPTAFFSGAIDEVAIYDKALTQPALAHHYAVATGADAQ